MNNLKCKEEILNSQTFSKILIDMSENVTKSKNLTKRMGPLCKNLDEVCSCI